VEKNPKKNSTPQIRPFARKISDLELWIVGLSVAASMVLTRLLLMAVIIAILVWMTRWYVSGKLTRRTPVDWSIIVLTLMIPVTLWATAFPKETQIQVLRLITGIALFYAIVNWCISEARLQIINFFLVFGGLLLAFLAPFSVEWSVDKLSFIPSNIYDRFVLLVSDTAHPNVMAGSLIILFPIAIAIPLFGWHQTGRLGRLTSLTTTIVIPIILILTQSRGAWLALFFIAMVMAVLRFRWGWIIVILFLIVTILGVFTLGFDEILDYLSSSNTVSGVDGRLEIWSRATYMIQDFSFTGVGMGSFGEVADLLYPFFLYTQGSIPHAHNLFLQIAVDLGIPGLIAWLATLLGI
jgi:putative inorganic carbon (HCO3(-)) transporter